MYITLDCDVIVLTSKYPLKEQKTTNKKGLNTNISFEKFHSKHTYYVNEHKQKCRNKVTHEMFTKFSILLKIRK